MPNGLAVARSPTEERDVLHPQPQELTLTEEREPVDGTCEACGAQELARYRLADYRGWILAVKCQSCLALVSGERITAPPQGQP